MVARVQYSLIVFVSLAFAQESIQTFSMKAAIQYALTHSPSLQNTYLDYQIARQKIAEVRSAGLPQINSTTTFRYFVEIPTSLVPGEFFWGAAGHLHPDTFRCALQLGDWGNRHPAPL